MNKVLLIWNIAITIALAMMVISGCSALDPQYANLPTEVKNNRSLIEQTLNLASSNRDAINSNNAAIAKNTLMISNIQRTTEIGLAASEAALKQYVEQLVQAYMQQ